MVGYNKRCKLCNCEQRAEAEQMHENGASLQQIVDYLAEHDVSLSKPAVKRHFDTHFMPKDEAAKRYFEQSASVMKKAVEKRLSDLEILDEAIARTRELHLLAYASIKQSLTEEKPVVSMYGKVIKNPETDEPMMEIQGPSKPIVDLANGAASELRQSIKLKAELLGDTPDPTMKVMFVDDLDE